MDYFRNFTLLAVILCFAASGATSEVSVSSAFCLFLFISKKVKATFCNLFSVQDTLKVSLYYESLCPDSVRFVVRQLYPGFLKLGDILDLDFIPYGFATVSITHLILYPKMMTPPDFYRPVL